MRHRLGVPLFVLALTVYCGASAATVYITRDGAGSKDGTTLGNAGACDAVANTPQATCAFFNNAANWGVGAAQIGPDTVVHVGDDSVTITATAGASGYLTFQGSGAAGNQITLRLATIVQAPYFCCNLGGGAVSLNGQNHLIVDGTVACGWNVATNSSEGTCVGVIQSTANGDALANQQESEAIYDGSVCTDIEIKNLGIYNMYLKSNTAVSGPSNSAAFLCQNSYSSVSFHDNQIHDVENTVWMVPFINSTGLNIYNNDVYNMNWGFIIGAGAGSITMTDVSIHGNHLHDMANWTNASNQYHHDGMYFFYASGTLVNLLHFSNLQVYNNIFDGNTTNGACSNCDMTSWWFTDQTDAYDSAYVFNNIFVATSNTPASAGPFLLGMSPASGTILIANNTLACPATGGGNAHIGAMGNDGNGGVTAYTVKNNLFSQCFRWINNTGTNGGSYASGGLNNNVYTAGNGLNLWDWRGSTFTSTLSTWQSVSGGDANAVSVVGSANLGGSYENNALSPIAGLIPQPGSAAIGAAANLTSAYCGTISALCSDIRGTARPSGVTAWDAGALQSTPTAPSFSPSAPYSGIPTNLTITDPNAGTHVTCYTTNGTTPATNGLGTGCTTGTAYTVPIAIAVTTTVKAISGTSTLTDSTVVSGVYTINAVAPSLPSRGGILLQ